MFYIIAPPHNTQLKLAAERVNESGIYKFWMDEFSKILFSNRVQDRSKVISPTNVQSGFESGFSPLQLQGKILTVVFLWGTCLVICLISFVFELIVNIFRNFYQYLVWILP